MPLVDFINHAADGPSLDAPGAADDGVAWLSAPHDYAPCAPVHLRLPDAPRASSYIDSTAWNCMVLHIVLRR